MGIVRLLEMPSDRRVTDYFYDNWDGVRRWPIGWPCEVVCSPPVSECPSLREHVEHFGWAFGSYAARFQFGPFRLDKAMRDRLNRDFEQF